MYILKDNLTGKDAVYKTELELQEDNGTLLFRFFAEHSQYYCANRGYNQIHSRGDVCEILIGSDPERKTYYEIEINPENDLMIAKMTYKGINEQGKAQLDIEFVVEPFIQSRVEKTKNGYIAELRFNKQYILTGEGEVYFNAYRIETDGGEKEKYLFALNPTLCGRFHTTSSFLYWKDFVKNGEKNVKK